MKPYGTLELTVSSPPQSFCEPLSLEELREYLRLPESSPENTEEQAMLEGFVIAAREQAEFYQNIDLTEKQYDIRFDYFPCEIDLGYPLRSVDLFTYMDSDHNTTTLTEGTDYIVDDIRGLVMPPYGESWPSVTLWPSSAILVRFTRGYSESHPFWSGPGQRILIGMKMLISAWHEGRFPVPDVPDGIKHLLSAGARPRIA